MCRTWQVEWKNSAIHVGWASISPDICYQGRCKKPQMKKKWRSLVNDSCGRCGDSLSRGVTCGGGFRAWPRNNEISSDPQAINQPSVTTRLILLTMDLSATKKQWIISFILNTATSRQEIKWRHNAVLKRDQPQIGLRDAYRPTGIADENVKIGPGFSPSPEIIRLLLTDAPMGLDFPTETRKRTI